MSAVCAPWASMTARCACLARMRVAVDALVDAVGAQVPGVAPVVQVGHQALVDQPLAQPGSVTGQASSMRRIMLRFIQSALDR